MFRRLAPLGLLLALPPAATAGAVPPATTADYAATLGAWQAHDARLLSIGWRLTRANAQFCRRTQSAIGLMLRDIRSDAQPRRARAALGLAGNLTVQAVAAGSPAESAGLRGGDEVLAIDGEAASAAGIGSEHSLHSRIDAILAAQGSLNLTLSRNGGPARTVTIAGETACRSRFALQRWGKTAQADGTTVRISVRLLAETAADDEAAAMVAHELAHNILGHRLRINAKGRNYLTVRRGEREADRLAPWLMANAGYDPAAAPRFMAAWGKRHDPGITRAPTHDGYRDRMAVIAGELTAIAAARTAHSPPGVVDWRAMFPDQGPE